MFSRLTLLTLAIAASACSRGGPPPEPRKADGTIALTRGPYLQLATQDSIRIVWRTREAIQPVLKWGKSADALTETLPDSAITLRQTKDENESGANPLHSAPDDTRQYEAVIRGLNADTLYHYSISNGTALMSPADGSCTFRTLPVPGADLQGDHQDRPGGQHRRVQPADRLLLGATGGPDESELHGHASFSAV